MNPCELITIIVPIYNTEKYLKRCLKSIQSQDYKNFECLMINDGSTDNSGEICTSFSNSDIRFNYLHKKNEGVSVARNVGIQHAKGKYLCFIDSDDFIEPNTLSTLISLITKYSADMVQCSNAESPNTKINDISKITILSKQQLFTESLSANGLLSPYITRCLFLTELAKKINFEQQLKYGEDFLYLVTYLSHCTKVVHTNLPLYHYVLNNESATQSKSKHSIQKVKDTLFSLERALPLCKNENQIALVKQRIFIGIQSWLFYQFANKQLFDKSNNINSFLFDKLKFNTKEYRKNPYIRLSQKFCLLFGVIAPYLLVFEYALITILKKIRR